MNTSMWAIINFMQATNSMRSTSSMSSTKKARTLPLLVIFLALNACVGSIVGVAVDTTIEVVKIPFKVAGAAIDLAIPGGDDED